LNGQEPDISGGPGGMRRYFEKNVGIELKIQRKLINNNRTYSSKIVKVRERNSHRERQIKKVVFEETMLLTEEEYRCSE
jgi:hypothetical protein